MEKINHESAVELRKLLDNVSRNIRALKHWSIERHTFSDLILINLILPKLDKETRKLFEMSLNTTEPPNWTDFIAFLEKRCQVLENTNKITNLNSRSFTPNVKAKGFLVNSKRTSTNN
ncbi:hypothetical protein X975_10845, partial [Stegodyphus mimosarum]